MSCLRAATGVTGNERDKQKRRLGQGPAFVPWATRQPEWGQWPTAHSALCCLLVGEGTPVSLSLPRGRDLVGLRQISTENILLIRNSRVGKF